MRGQRTGAAIAGLNYFNLVSFEVSDSKFQELRSLTISKLLSYCIPQAVSGQQLDDVIVKYLADHPETRLQPADSLIFSALHEAFPCAEP